MLRGIGLGAILMAAIMYFVYGKSQSALSDDEIKVKARELGMMTVNEFQEKELNSLKDKLPNLSDIKVDEEAETSTAENNVTDTSSTTSNTPSEEGGETSQSSDEGNKTSEEGTTAEDNAGTTETGTAQTEPSETGTAEAGTSTDGNSTASEAKTSDTQNSDTKTEKSKSGDTKNKKAAKKAKPKPKPKQVKEAPKPSVAYSKVSFTVSVGMTSERVSASLKALGIIDDSAKFNRYLVSNGYASRIKVGTVELQAGQSYAEIASKLVK